MISITVITTAEYYLFKRIIHGKIHNRLQVQFHF